MIATVVAMDDAGFIIGSYVVTFGAIAAYTWRVMRSARRMAERVDEDHKYWL